MEFPFPPEPPGYNTVLAARAVLVTWALLGLCLVAFRLRQWKYIRAYEIPLWALAAGLSGITSSFGNCPTSAWDNNAWLAPAIVAAISVSAAGITICLSKTYVDGPDEQRWPVIGTTVIGSLVVCAFLTLDSTSLRHPREASLRSQCRNNLKQIGLALHNYHDEHRSFPPSVNSRQQVSWRVSILPYLEEQAIIFSRYDRSQPWDRPPNNAIATTRCSVYLCNSNYHSLTDTSGRWFTAYSMPTGPATVGASPKGTSLADIRDGSNQTALVVEACGSEIVWTEPRDINVNVLPAGINLKGSKPGKSGGWLSSYHHRGAHLLLADGSVRMVSGETDPTILKKLVTIDGGETLDDF